MSDHDPIFICGRFRAGTSFLWHVFDQLANCCAWYEPLHPQLLTHIQGTPPKADHVGINDYWHSYRRHPQFKQSYDASFAYRQLWLEATDQCETLRQYIQSLIDLSAEQQPVLQFNRMDLRLPWLKRQFPQAKIVYIERNPLQLWQSQRKHLCLADRDNESHSDAYELMQWSVALTDILPFMAHQPSRHGFFRFYCLYRLSKQLGHAHADLVLSLDEDVFESARVIEKINQLVPLNKEQREHLKKHISIPNKEPLSNEQVEVWSAIMTDVDILFQFSGLCQVGKLSLSQIKCEHPDYWQSLAIDLESHHQEILQVLANQQSQLTEQLQINQQQATIIKNHEQREKEGNL